MILIVKTNKEVLHDREFVNPIENIVKEDFKTVHYSSLTPKLISSSDKIIITGTSLKDNEFLDNLNNFEWILEYKNPLLGICAGHQIISLIFGGKKKTKTEIGFYKENFKKEFLGLKGEQEVYHLHNNYTTLPKGFEKFTDSEIPQAIRKDNLYGILFHPEVRNKELIEKFIRR